MNSPQQTCDPDQIKSFLSGALTSAQEQSLQTHLDVCDTCRENMHSQAAEESYWEEATQLFSDDGGYQSCRLLGETRQDEFFLQAMCRCKPKACWTCWLQRTTPTCWGVLAPTKSPV